MSTVQKFILALLMAAACMLDCGFSPVAGNSAETGNAMVLGKVVNPSGRPSKHAVIALLPVAHNPVVDGRVSLDTTGDSGEYMFRVKDTGLYNIFAVQPESSAVSLTGSLALLGKDETVPTDTLRKQGTVRIARASYMDADNGYVYIPGTTIYSFTNTDTVALQPVPPNRLFSIRYAVRGNATSRIVRDSIMVATGATVFIIFPDWPYSGKLYLNTTSSGAGVTGDVLNFPVLIRLNAGTFPFAQAKAGGEDIRFTKSDGSAASFEIESWDSATASAAVWVKVDTVYGNNSSQYLVMQWGNHSAVSASSSEAVFDTAGGYQAVWHLGESTGGNATDATANHYNGTTSGSFPTATQGIIGTAQQFNGSSSYIEIPNTAASKLAFLAHGNYTVSAWVYLDSLPSAAGQFGDIVAKGNLEYHLQVTRGAWQFSEMESGIGWDDTQLPAQAGAWVHLVGVRNGTKQYLFINASAVDSTITVAIDSSGQTSTPQNLSLGGLPSMSRYFLGGKIDEARVLNVSQSANWVKLCFMNQRLIDALVSH